MAPGRARSSTRGLTRMDAALDHMVPMGFRKADIRKKVKELLKVYGGDKGWVAIEEGSYQLLLDTLLEEGGGSQPGSPLLMDEAGDEDDMHESVGTSIRVTRSRKRKEDTMHGDAGSSSTAGHANANAIPVLEMAEAEKTCAGGGSYQDSAVTSMDDDSFTEHDITNNTSDVFPPRAEHIPLEIRHAMPTLPPSRPQNVVHAPPPSSPPPPLPTSSPPPIPPPPSSPPPPSPPPQPKLAQRRKPCYGWWGEETEVISLPPMPIKVNGAYRGRI